jgi:esterase/lipase superfamily enzyme
MPRRRIAAFALAAGFVLCTMPVPQRAAAASSRPLTSIALFGGPSPAYVICPQSARTREDCLPGAGHVAGAAALQTLRRAALAPGIVRVVLFIAGYHTNLLGGRGDAAGIQNVLGPHFLVVHIDWGSKGTTTGYEADGLAAKRQTPAFAAFVSDLHRALPEREVDVFAHSMGSRVAAGAMATVKPASDRKAIVLETVFAAPDLTLHDYERAITRNPEPFGHVTIYVSKHDKALLISTVVHFHQRIGQLADWHAVVANTSVVDASSADPKGLGHGYAIHSAAVIRDIAAIFLHAPVPHPAWTRVNPATVMWTLVPARVPTAIAFPPSHAAS